MRYNDRREINFSETYKFGSNFEIKIVRLKGLTDLKCDRKNSRKIKKTKHAKLI